MNSGRMTLTERRLAWMRKVMNGTAGEWVLHHEKFDFIHARKCSVCGRDLYHGYEIRRSCGLVLYVGPQCAVTAMAYQTGGLR